MKFSREMQFRFLYNLIWLKKTSEYKKIETFRNEESKRAEQVSYSISSTYNTF